MKTSEGPLRASRGTTLTLCMLFTLLLCTWSTAPACAEDKDESASEEVSLKDRIKKLQADFKEAKKKKDGNSINALLESCPDLYEDCVDDDELKLEILKFVGTAAKGSKGHELKTLVLQTLANIGDARCAKYVRPYLKQRNLKRADATLIAAVTTASEVPDPSFVTPLLKIVTKSKTTGIVEDAVQALGKYRDAKLKVRAKILETLVDQARKVKPGPRPRMRGGGESLDGGYGSSGSPYGRESGTGARWAALSASVPSALNALTGQEVRSMGEWMALVKSSKGKYGELFVGD